MTFKIYVDRLKDNEEEKIEESFDPSTLSMDDDDLAFVGPITLKGRAYLASQHLIISLAIEANAQMPCSICNEEGNFPICIDNFSHEVDIETIKGAIYDYSEEIRSTILIRVPQFYECQEGNCPERKAIKKFLKTSSDETYTPFADLDS